MADVDIASLSVQISANVDKAKASIQALVAVLGALKTAISGFDKKSMKGFLDATKALNDIKVDNASVLGVALKSIKKAAEDIPESTSINVDVVPDTSSVEKEIKPALEQADAAITPSVDVSNVDVAESKIQSELAKTDVTIVPEVEVPKLEVPKIEALSVDPVSDLAEEYPDAARAVDFFLRDSKEIADSISETVAPVDVPKPAAAQEILSSVSNADVAAIENATDAVEELQQAVQSASETCANANIGESLASVENVGALENVGAANQNAVEASSEAVSQLSSVAEESLDTGINSVVDAITNVASAINTINPDAFFNVSDAVKALAGALGELISASSATDPSAVSSAIETLKAIGDISGIFSEGAIIPVAGVGALSELVKALGSLGSIGNTLVDSEKLTGNVTAFREALDQLSGVDLSNVDTQLRSIAASTVAMRSAIGGVGGIASFAPKQQGSNKTRTIEDQTAVAEAISKSEADIEIALKTIEKRKYDYETSKKAYEELLKNPPSVNNERATLEYSEKLAKAKADMSGKDASLGRGYRTLVKHQETLENLQAKGKEAADVINDIVSAVEKVENLGAGKLDDGASVIEQIAYAANNCAIPAESIAAAMKQIEASASAAVPPLQETANEIKNVADVSTDGVDAAKAVAEGYEKVAEAARDASQSVASVKTTFEPPAITIEPIVNSETTLEVSTEEIKPVEIPASIAPDIDLSSITDSVSNAIEGIDGISYEIISSSKNLISYNILWWEIKNSIDGVKVSVLDLMKAFSASDTISNRLRGIADAAKEVAAAIGGMAGRSLVTGAFETIGNAARIWTTFADKGSERAIPAPDTQASERETANGIYDVGNAAETASSKLLTYEVTLYAISQALGDAKVSMRDLFRALSSGGSFSEWFSGVKDAAKDAAVDISKVFGHGFVAGLAETYENGERVFDALADKASTVKDAIGSAFGSVKSFFVGSGAGTSSAAMPDMSRFSEGVHYSGDAVSDALEGVDELTESTEEAGDAADGAKKKFEPLGAIGRTLASGFDVAKRAVRSFASALKSIKKEIDHIKRSFSKMLGGNIIKKLIDRFRRIALYRAMRSALSAITRGVGDAFQALALRSDEANAALSALKNMGSDLSGSLAAALMPALQAIIPILQQLTAWAISAFNAINMFFSVIGGKGKYTRVVKANASYADSLRDVGGAASSAKKALMGFDEINMLNLGGGGGGSIDSSTTFEEVEISESLAKAIADADFSAVGVELADKLKYALERINWENIKQTAENVGKSIVTFINGFFSRPETAQALGKSLGELVNSAVRFLLPFKNLNAVQIGEWLSSVVNAAIDSVNWKQLGSLIGLKFIKMLQGLAVFLKGLNWDNVSDAIKEALEGLDITISETDFSGIVSGIATGLLNLIVAAVENIDGLLELGLKIAGQIVDGLVKAMSDPATLEKIKRLPAKINEALAKIQWSTVASKVFQLIGAALNALRVFVFNLDFTQLTPVVNIIGALGLLALLKTTIAEKLGGTFVLGKILLGVAVVAQINSIITTIKQDVDTNGGLTANSWKAILKGAVAGALGVSVGAITHSVTAGLAVTYAVTAFIDPVIEFLAGDLPDANSMINPLLDALCLSLGLAVGTLGSSLAGLAVTASLLVLVKPLIQLIRGNLTNKDAIKSGLAAGLGIATGLLTGSPTAGFVVTIGVTLLIDPIIEFKNTIEDAFKEWITKNYETASGIGKRILGLIYGDTATSNVLSISPDNPKFSTSGNGSSSSAKANNQNEATSNTNNVQNTSNTLWKVLPQDVKSVRELRAELKTVTEEYDTLKQKLGEKISLDAPTEEIAALEKQISAATAKAHKLKLEIAGINSKTITLTVKAKVEEQSAKTKKIIADVIGTDAAKELGLFAGGGIVPHGSMFIAGERGPEIVGRIGNQTGVLNDQQITDVVSAKIEQNEQAFSVDYDRLGRAVASAMVQSGVGAVYLDGKQINKSSNTASKRAGKLGLAL